jgi:DNA-binding response OmpR family regulator
VVLVVDDDPTVTDTLVEILNQSGYVAIASYDGEDAVETALLVPPDLVIADVALPGISGIEVAATLRTKLPEVKIVLLAGGKPASDPLAAGRIAGQAFAVVEKPVHPAELLAKVSESLKSEKAEPVVGVL